MTVLAALKAVPVIGILRRLPREQIEAVALAATDAGLRVVEVTMDSDAAADHIRWLRKELPSEVAVGAGTVISLSALDQAAEAGAEFIVSPGIVEQVLGRAMETDMPAIPGVLTPTEVMRALEFRPAAIKLFPAGPVGPEYVRSLLGPFPGVSFMCSGGVTAAKARSFLDAGALAVGLGAELFSPPDPDGVRQRVRDLLDRFSGS